MVFTYFLTGNIHPQSYDFSHDTMNLYRLFSVTILYLECFICRVCGVSMIRTEKYQYFIGNHTAVIVGLEEGPVYSTRRSKTACFFSEDS